LFFKKRKKEKKKEKYIIVIYRWTRKIVKEKKEDPKGTLPHTYSYPPLLTMHPSIISIIFPLHCFDLCEECVFYRIP